MSAVLAITACSTEKLTPGLSSTPRPGVTSPPVELHGACCKSSCMLIYSAMRRSAGLDNSHHKLSSRRGHITSLNTRPSTSHDKRTRNRPHSGHSETPPHQSAACTTSVRMDATCGHATISTSACNVEVTTAAKRARCQDNERGNVTAPECGSQRRTCGSSYSHQQKIQPGGHETPFMTCMSDIVFVPMVDSVPIFL